MPELVGGLSGNHSCCDGDCAHEERGRVKVCQPWGQHLRIIVLRLQEPGYCLLQAAEGGSCCCIGAMSASRQREVCMAAMQDLQDSSLPTSGHPAPGCSCDALMQDIPEVCKRTFMKAPMPSGQLDGTVFLSVWAAWTCQAGPEATRAPMGRAMARNVAIDMLCRAMHV